jgi:hypothetical protein
VTTLQQILQLSEGGSYSFGYENTDGFFRMENRDVSGFVDGRYSYIEINGITQEIGSIFLPIFIIAACCINSLF